MALSQTFSQTLIVSYIMGTLHQSFSELAKLLATIMVFLSQRACSSIKIKKLLKTVSINYYYYFYSLFKTMTLTHCQVQYMLGVCILY